MSATYRVATAADVDCLVRGIQEFDRLLDPGLPSPQELHANILRLLDDPNTDFFVAIDADGSCAGILQQRYRFSVWLSAEEANIEDAFVFEEHRGKGYGRGIVEHALEAARKRGAVRAVLDTNEANAVAIALYESMGFTCERSYASNRGRHVYYGVPLR